VDPVILGCVGIAALGMVALGCALIIAPVRAMRALKEWYVVFPDITGRSWVFQVACRAAGVAFVIGAVALALSTARLVSQLG